jgi:3-oxoacyl-[acyl-carrier protein] reductase
MSIKTVLVTGSGRGIGREIALDLARRGTSVAVHCLRNMEEAEKTAESVRAYGAAAAVFRADLTDEGEAARLVRDVESRFGGIDILVNNVGPILVKRWNKLSGADWEGTIKGSLLAAFFCIKAALPGMKERGWGRIVNIGYSRVEQLTAFFEITPYAAAKTGLLILTRTAAADLGKHGITVNMVSPGLMEGGVLPKNQRVPLGRLGKPEDIAAAVSFLVSDEASYITGENIIVSGGWKI